MLAEQWQRSNMQNNRIVCVLLGMVVLSCGKTTDITVVVVVVAVVGKDDVFVFCIFFFGFDFFRF